jgi:hypothetical protein
MAVGAGPLGATMRSDTIYEPSLQMFGRVSYSWVPRRTYGFEIEAVGSRDATSGDCIPGFTICAPAPQFLGASANALWAFGYPVQANLATVGAGFGVFRVAPTYKGAVPPQAALGVNIGVDMPFLTEQDATLTIGLRGLAFPFVQGESLYMGLLTLGFRRW